MNPFFRRATEYIQEENTFLSLVSPEPLTEILSRYKGDDVVFRKPVKIFGMPGSGKTMLATLVQFNLVEAILNGQRGEYAKLVDALSDTGIVNEGRPRVAAIRIPIDSGYRAFWELSYDEKTKTELVLRLLQARTMISLIRALTKKGSRNSESIRFIPINGSENQFDCIGGENVENIRLKAYEIDKEIYSIGAGLRLRKQVDFPDSINEPYQPFKCIREIELEWKGEKIHVIPHVILDDVQSLHPNQFRLLFKELSQRDIQFGRWTMMREDLLETYVVLKSVNMIEACNLQADRDYLTIHMQGTDRNSERIKFRSFAKDIANRYLPKMQTLAQKNLFDFGELVTNIPQCISKSKLNKLINTVDTTQNKLNILPQRRKSIEDEIENYFCNSKSLDKNEDLKLEMVKILFHRYLSYNKNQLTLIDDGSEKLQKVDSGLVEGAKIHLSHKYNRALHFGFDEICDASNANAELFLHLAGTLVDLIEAKIFNGKAPMLDATEQHQWLLKMAERIMDDWAFPYASEVRTLVSRIAKQCLQESLLDYAPLGAGANTIGVLESEFTEMLKSGEKLAKILKFGFIYNAINIERKYKQGNKYWCLIELSGLVCLANNLTLKRGGFIPHKINKIREYLKND